MDIHALGNLLADMNNDLSTVIVELRGCQTLLNEASAKTAAGLNAFPMFGSLGELASLIILAKSAITDAEQAVLHASDFAEQIVG